MTHKLLKLSIFSFLSIALIACNNDDDSNEECTNVICDTALEALIVSLTYQNQNPVAFYAFQVINTDSGDDITIPLSPNEFEGSRENGRYPLITDLEIEIGQELRLQFRGFIGNQEVISSNYTVGTDCCHVMLVSGNLQLIL